MGFFENLQKKQQENASIELKKVLPEGEEVLQIYMLNEDFCAITDKRVVFVDKKVISSKRTLTSVPFANINFVALKRGSFLSNSKEVVISTGGFALEIDAWDAEQAFTIIREISKRM